MRTKKSAIVLFVTLIFILAISALIVKNLDDSNKFIDESNSEASQVQSLLAVKNLKEEFLKYFVKHKDTLDELLEKEPFNEEFLLEYENVKANLKFEKYEEKHDVNLLTKEESKYQEIEQLFMDNDISDFYTFKQMVVQNSKLYGEIESFIQLNHILEAFIQKTDNEDIRPIKEFLSFLSTEKQQLLLCNMEIQISGKSVKSDFIYDIAANSVKGFDIVFK